MFIIKRNDAIYHSDKKFYIGYISFGNTYPIVYKRKSFAEKQLEKLNRLFNDNKTYIEEV